MKQDGQVLSYDLINVDRQADRTHLANKAYEYLGEAEREAFSKRMLALSIDDFCRELWPHWVSRVEVVNERGDPDMGLPSFAVNPWIPEEGGTLMFGQPGTGKSTLLYSFGLAVHHGKNGLWNVSQRRNVLVVNLERPPRSVKRRLAPISLAMGMPADTELPMLHARGLSFSDIEERVGRAVEENKTEVLMIDSLSRAGYGKLIADEVANLAMDTFNRLCKCWLAIGHSPRGDATHTYGSVMFDAACDLSIQVSSQEKLDGSLGIGLQGQKANDIRRPGMTQYALRYDEYGLTEIRRAKEGEFPEIDAETRTGNYDLAKKYLGRVGEADAEQISAQLGVHRTTIIRTLNNAQDVHSRREGKRLLYSLKAV